MKKVSKILTVIASIVLWIIILLAALFAFVTLSTNDNKNVKSLFGVTPMKVLSNSMSPTFNKGDLIVIKKCDTKALKEGDIITFHTIIDNEYALNTHRIDKITDNGGVRSYVTKGDNNSIADTHIIADGDIVGKYTFKMKGVGKVMDFLSTKLGFFLVIVFPMLLFFVYQIYHLVMVSINLKKAIAAESGNEANAEADAKKAEAEAALEEARRLKAEAEAMKAEAMKLNAQKEESADKE